MRLHSVFLFCSMAFLTCSATAQEVDWRLYRPDSSRIQKAPHYGGEQTRPLRPEYHQPGRVTLKVNERIEKLDSLKRLHPAAMAGYRLQLFFGDRAKAQKIRGEFLKQHPETGAYISYLAPNFRLRVGDFRSKMECERLKNEIRNDFPGSYIVRDQINMPALRSGEQSVVMDGSKE